MKQPQIIQQPMDNLTLLFLCTLYRVPYNLIVKALELGIKMPAIRKLRDEINANQNGKFTPIQEKTVDDAIDAFSIVAEEYYSELYAANETLLNQARLEMKAHAQLMKQQIKKDLEEKHILN